MSYSSDDSEAEDASSDSSGENGYQGPPMGLLRFIIASQASRAEEPVEAATELAGIGRLLDRLASRLSLQPIGRLDSLLLQVLIARVSMAEVQYREQLQEALRVSLEEAQEKAQGPPPALEEDIQSLPEVKVAPEHLDCSDKTSCMVCLEAFRVGQAALQLPCSHMFCPECITEWLRRHRTCPMCREEVMDVEAPEYSFDMCGFHQLDLDICECDGEMVEPCIFPTCSHAFSTPCMQAHVWRSQQAQRPAYRTVACPLCSRVSTVQATLLRLDVNQPKGRMRNPLSNREPTGWRIDTSTDPPPPPGGGAVRLAFRAPPASAPAPATPHPHPHPHPSLPVARLALANPDTPSVDNRSRRSSGAPLAGSLSSRRPSTTQVFGPGPLPAPTGSPRRGLHFVPARPARPSASSPAPPNPPPSHPLAAPASSSSHARDEELAMAGPAVGAIRRLGGSRSARQAGGAGDSSGRGGRRSAAE